LRISARINKKNHKSSPRRGEDLEEGYHCEGLGDLSPNYSVIQIMNLPG